MYDAHVCGAAAANKPTGLPVIRKYSVYNEVRYIVSDNDNKRLCADLCMSSYYTILFVVILACTLSPYKTSLL